MRTFGSFGTLIGILALGLVALSVPSGAQNPFEPLPGGPPQARFPEPAALQGGPAGVRTDSTRRERDPDDEERAGAVGNDAGLLAALPGVEGPYLLQPGDGIEIQVLEDPSLNRSLRIQPDGLISFPLAGALLAGGKTPQQLADDLRDALSDDFLDPPTVTVTLVGVSLDEAQDPLTFYIFGEIASPGRYQIQEPIDVVQALALAGGPRVFAATSRIQVRKRDENGTEQLSFFDFDAVIEGRAVPFAVMIDDDDIIYVPEAGLFE